MSGEGSENFKRHQRMIRRAMEPIDPLAPARHLVKDGVPLSIEGAALMQAKNLNPPAEQPKHSLKILADRRTRK